MTGSGPFKSVVKLFGAPEVAKQGRERLVDVAIDLFYTHGFNAVGLDQVLATAGVTKTTFYKHFECKDELIVAAVEKHDQWERRAWSDELARRGEGDPIKTLLAIFDVLDHWFNDEAFGGCLFINTAAEFPNPQDPVHQAAAKHKRHTRDDVCELAKQGGAAKPDEFADRFQVLVEGTLILRQVHGRDDAAAIARPMAQTLIDSYFPTS